MYTRYLEKFLHRSSYQENKVGSMDDLKQVALTSDALNNCESIVLPQLKSFVQDTMDPFQFEYQNNSCEVTLLVAINEVTCHLDSSLSVKKNEYMPLLFEKT